jgi:hypothetical protein
MTTLPLPFFHVAAPKSPFSSREMASDEQQDIVQSDRGFLQEQGSAEKMQYGSPIPLERDDSDSEVSLTGLFDSADEETGFADYFAGGGSGSPLLEKYVGGGSEAGPFHGNFGFPMGAGWEVEIWSGPAHWWPISDHVQVV